MLGIDVLNPKLITVGGRTYRVQGSSASTLGHAPERGEHVVGRRGDWQGGEDNDDGPVEGLGFAPRSAGARGRGAVVAAGGSRAPAAIAADDAAGEEDMIDESLISQEGNNFFARLSCDAEVYPFVIGREGRTKKKIEAETGAQLTIPSKQQQQQQQGSGGGDIVIRGPSRQVVSSAYVRTELAIHSAISGRLLDYNYFLSLPLATPAAVRSFEAFRRAALTADPAAAAAAGLEESVFMKPQHLHLTLVMLKLYSDEKRHKAQQVLDSLRGPVAKLLCGAPLKVHLQGLEYMNDDPAAMHVLYLKVGEVGPGGRLEALCDMVVEAFGRAGLLLPQDDRKVKLHATIINTRYRKRGPGPRQSGGRGGGGGAGGGAEGEERQPFDGRALLQEHRALDLGIHELQAVHMSQRGAYGEDGYYRCARKLDLRGAAAAGGAAEGPGGTGVEERS